MTVAIHTRALHKRYGSHTALHGLDLTVQSGSVFGLIGPNGAGKTTTLRTLLDIIRPTSGDITVLGASPRAGGAALRRRIGYVPGELRLEGRVKGRALLRHLAEISGPVAPGTIEQLAERLGLDLARPVRTLSKGNKQKLGLVQAFMHRPDLLVLDEPTSGLDPLVQREFLAMVREARDAGQTVLLSSHVLSEIQQAADDVAVLAQGRIVAEGPVSSLRIASVRRVRATVTGVAAETVADALAAASGIEDVDVAAAGDLVRVSATARGDIDPVIRAIAAGTIRDLTVEEPDLEESVLDLYARNGAAS
ncbi:MULTISPECIES: ABC transporter ATP-binding protein [Micrococcales]|jgi:ABC-2 type transport system ATP-binding protein|uniref:ABC transporter ATP-binding protein n=1 Tax=Micrococcales TaxID=85006 RepID=UPI00097C96B3|nr:MULTISPECIES: ABC transporter ATP-binding protein [Microbacterium]MBZ6372481.1 ABC transporter ATP-binding protein [Microbacterium hominis]MBD3758720.1 ABC transporter ATP-binding protein [Microbacterium sp.]MCG7414416.1 ABC transporter ATP-binding protein [Microbacterium aurum]ONI66710.1 ABC transporter [Microbacterium sp. CSI-V]PZU44104.1 MAG: ABC transporter ATP-binding protein [Microbacterium sp.]